MRYWENDKPLFENPRRTQNQTTKYSGGMLFSHSKPLFHPTEANLYDQVFNLNAVLEAFLLPRLDYFRKYFTGIGDADFDHNDKASFEAAVERYRGKLEAMCEGFWIAVNVDDHEQTDEQKAKVLRSRQLLVENWDSLWL